MLNTLKIKYYNKRQFIRNPKTAEMDKMHRGLPELDSGKCSTCNKCEIVCPTNALQMKPFQLDMAKCIFCGDCQRACKQEAVRFTTFNKISTDSKSALIVHDRMTHKDHIKIAFKTRKEIKALFGRSLKLREVSTGGCNGCEMELNACLNSNFDMGRYGIEFVASPRHADGLVITGPMTKNMSEALEDAYNCIPEPKVLILTGTCAISGGLFVDSNALDRTFLEKYKIDLFIPGCPIHPLTFINGVLSFIGKGAHHNKNKN